MSADKMHKLVHMANQIADYFKVMPEADALKGAAELGLRRVVVNSDSELMVKQYNGEYSVKNPDLKGLYDEAKTLARRFDSVVLTHVRRAANKRADELCNAVLDGRPPKCPGQAATRKSKASRATAVRSAGVDEQAIACLRTALTSRSPIRFG